MRPPPRAAVALLLPIAMFRLGLSVKLPLRTRPPQRSELAELPMMICVVGLLGAAVPRAESLLIMRMEALAEVLPLLDMVNRLVGEKVLTPVSTMLPVPVTD